MISELTQLAIKAAIEASKDILTIYQSGDFEIEKKKDNSPLTRADKAAHKIISSILQESKIPILSEEGKSIPYETRKYWDKLWIVDPIDGTVNYTYGIPHACVSIARQQRLESNKTGDEFEPLVGVVFDPFNNELWTAIKGQAAKLNGKRISVNDGGLKEAMLAIGFAKDKATMDYMIPYFIKLAQKIRKPRMMGSAALAMTYVASGRFHGYIESKIQIWDVAAGGLILECAGGEFWRKPRKKGKHKYAVIASNGKIRKQIERICGPLDPDGLLSS